MRIARFLMLALALGCGDDDSSTDAAADATNDSTVIDDARTADGSADEGADEGVEAGPDEGVDEGLDEGVEMAVDEGVDTGPVDCSAERTAPTLGFETIARASQPVHITAAPGEDRLYITEKEGQIRVYEDGSLVDTPFLRVTGINTSGEQGLLSTAFAPDYARSGRFFVYVTPSGPRRNAIDEYRRSDDSPLRADAEAVQRIMTTSADEFSNHNGGIAVFGPDGYLYAGIGDEGSGGDPNDNGLDTDTLFGSIARLDIDNADGRFAAPGNPFLDGGGLPQIWAYGARNPWRISFDRMTGDLYVADVGQNEFEEISVIAPDEGGANLGWRAYEGFEVFRPGDLDRIPDHHEPVHVYPHANFDRDNDSVRGGSSITGGYVYRGTAIDGLQGFYLFGDFNSNDLAAFYLCDGEATNVQRLNFEDGLPGSLTSFGEDNDGELYMTFIGGEVVRLTASE
ncbi:MAG: PQQ-dependent sugar dehydrogenase [Myxococcota bacterium]